MAKNRDKQYSRKGGNRSGESGKNYGSARKHGNNDRDLSREDYEGAYNGHYRGNGSHAMDHKDGNYGGFYTRSGNVKGADRREAYENSDDYSELPER